MQNQPRHDVPGYLLLRRPPPSALVLFLLILLHIYSALRRTFSGAIFRVAVLLAGLLSLLLLAGLLASLLRFVLSLIWIVGHGITPFFEREEHVAS
jgi:hypothetical protein